MPYAYWVSRVCDEFPRYGPAEAERAIRQAPVGWLEEVIEARHYAKAKQMVETTKPSDLPKDHALIDLVLEIEKERKAERVKARLKKTRRRA